MEKAFGTNHGHRSLWIDILRGFAIVLVIANHCGIEFVPVFEYSVIPIFFLISGILLERGRQQRFLHFMLDKSRRLIPPYLLWALVFALLYCRAPMLQGDWKQVWRDVIVWPANIPLWFLKALWWAFLIVGAMRAWGAFRTWARAAVATLALVAISLPMAAYAWHDKPLLTGLPQGVIAASFLAIGMLIQRCGVIHTVLNVAHSRRWPLPLLAGILFLVTATLLHPGFLPVLVDSADVGKPLWLFYPLALSSCAALFLIAVTMRRSYVLAFLGRNSMVIFCSHMVFVRALQNAGMPDGWLLVITAAACAALTAALGNVVKRYLHPCTNGKNS